MLGSLFAVVRDSSHHSQRLRLLLTCVLVFSRLFAKSSDVHRTCRTNTENCKAPSSKSIKDNAELASACIPEFNQVHMEYCQSVHMQLIQCQISQPFLSKDYVRSQKPAEWIVSGSSHASCLQHHCCICCNIRFTYNRPPI